MNTKTRVESILKYCPKARNSDKELLVIYLQKSGMELTDKQIEVFMNMPSTESIRRIRQKLQEEGKYLADKEVEDKRYELFKERRNGFFREYDEIY